MKTLLLVLAPAALVLGFVPARGSGPAAPSATAAETYDIDAVHSGVVFRIEHLGVARFYGRFNEVGGTYEMDPADPTKGSVEVEIPADSVDTANERRDGHLKSADFFAVEEFPTITFESTKIEEGEGDDAYVLTGDLTLHGVKKPVEADLTYGGSNSDPRGQHRTGFEARFTIRRSDFGMTYGLEGGGLGDEVDVTVFVEGVRRGDE